MRSRTLPLLALVAAACSSSPPPPVRLVVEASPSSVSLSAVVGVLEDGHVNCGAVAISPDLVITAAHCVRPGMIALRDVWGVEILSTAVIIDLNRDLSVLQALPGFILPNFYDVAPAPWESTAHLIRPVRGWQHDLAPLVADRVFTPVNFGDSGSPLILDDAVIGLVITCKAREGVCTNNGGGYTAVYPLPL